MSVLLSVERALPSAGESSSTLSVAVPSGTTKLVVFASNCLFNPRTVSSIAFNTSESFTAVTGGSITDTTPYIRTEAWFLDNPTITTANVVVTWSGAARGGVTVLCLDDAASGQPAAVNTGQVTGSVAASTVAVASTSGGIVLSGYAVRRGDATTASLTAGTSIENFIGSATSGDPSTRCCVASQAGTGSSVSTTWTPSGTGERAAHVVLAISAEATAPTITTQPTAQTALLSNGGTATFTVAATSSGGSLTYDWELETSVGGGVYANVADGSGGTWAGQAAATLSGTFTATTLDGRRVRCNVTDSNGTTTANAVTLTVKNGPTLSGSGVTNGSGVATRTLVCDYVCGTGEFIALTATAGGVTVRGSARSA